MRLARQPLVHFLAAGGLLFAVERRWQPAAAPPRPEPVVISAARREALVAEFALAAGHAPAPENEAALVEHAVDEEVLYREALARGLDRGDRSIRQRVIEKMQALGEASGDADAVYRAGVALGLDRDDAIVRRMLVEKMRLLAAPPALAVDEAEVARFFAAHAARYRAPVRVSFWQVFVAAHGASPAADAAALRARLVADRVAPDVAAARGDVFPLGDRWRDTDERDLVRSFGPDVARAVLALAPGLWSAPLRSAYGEHLVWVDAVEPAAVPPLAAVHARVVEDWRAEHRAAAARAALQALRARYEVRVEGAS